MASSRRHGAATPSMLPRETRDDVTPSTRSRKACAVPRFTPNAVFGTKDKFTKYYEGPILRGREPDSTDKQKKLGKARRDLGVPSCGGAFTSFKRLESISR